MSPQSSRLTSKTALAHASQSLGVVARRVRTDKWQANQETSETHDERAFTLSAPRGQLMEKAAPNRKR